MRFTRVSSDMVRHRLGGKKRKNIEIEELANIRSSSIDRLKRSAPKTVNSISRYSKRWQSFQGNSVFFFFL